MDVDRKKHDVDVIERVLGGAGADAAANDRSTRLLDIEVPSWDGFKPSTLELTVGLPEESRVPPEFGEHHPAAGRPDDERH